MDYVQSIKYLESFKKMGIRLGLERIKSLLNKLGDPQNSFRSIHIAGTNGKGSVAAMLSSILFRSGHRVGLYTSPHLVDYTERLRINEKNISKIRFANAVRKTKNAIKSLPEMSLTEFEVLTAAAFLLLKQEKVEIAVIEVGLGGRLDATNVIDPILSVITNIDYDHMDVLGRSLRKIAKEKAGIIKKGVPLVTGEIRTKRLLKAICGRSGSRIIGTERIAVRFSPFLGKHQIENTKVVLVCINALNGLGYQITSEQALKGLKKAFWPGRLQIIKKDPLMILDGAHNPAGAKALYEYLSTLKKKVSFVIGMQANKDIKRFIAILKPIACGFYIVRSSNPSAAPQKRIADSIGKNKIRTLIFRGIKAALSSALKCECPICITGSLYLVGDVLGQKLIDL